MTGRRYGRLVVSHPVERHKSPNGTNHVKWLCVCDCGTEIVADGASIRSGNTHSCGCLHRERAATITYRHGHSRVGSVAAEFKIWCGIRKRCTNPKCKSYPNYGGRGITLCAAWLWDFQAFLDHVGPRPSNSHSIDRIDNSKGYEPGNVRWATRTEQNSNQRRNRHLEHEGVAKTITQWTKEKRITRKTISDRLKRGLPIDQVLAAGNARTDQYK